MNSPRKCRSAKLEPIDGSENSIVLIPEEVLASEDWRVGDVLDLEATPESLRLTNRSKREREQFRDGMDVAAETDGCTHADAKASIPSDTGPQRPRTYRFKQVKLAKLNQAPSITPLKGEAALALLKQLGIAGDDGKPTKAYR
jgi:hypothetical protein